MRSKQSKQRIAQVYSDRLRRGDGSDISRSLARTYGSDLSDISTQGVLALGCGNPVALASLRSDEVVLDLGSGTGLDCFLAANQVGPRGKVIGIDFTGDMLERAMENSSKQECTNVLFICGDIEELPLAERVVDVVLSNCVINLTADRDAVFREAFRVLRVGGRLMVSDIVLCREPKIDEVEDFMRETNCISGSLVVEEYLSKILAAGFSDVSYTVQRPPGRDQFWFSGSMSATKV